MPQSTSKSRLMIMKKMWHFIVLIINSFFHESLSAAKMKFTNLHGRTFRECIDYIIREYLISFWISSFKSRQAFCWYISMYVRHPRCFIMRKNASVREAHPCHAWAFMNFRTNTWIWILAKHIYGLKLEWGMHIKINPHQSTSKTMQL